MRTLRLGGPRAADRRRDEVRDGTLAFISPNGLDVVSSLLIDALPQRGASRVLTGMDTEGAVAMAAATLWPKAAVTWTHLDLYVSMKVSGVVADNRVDGVTGVTSADLPTGPFDLVALPLPARGERQLMWDLLESAHDALEVGGRLVVATDGKGTAVRDAVKRVFRNVAPGPKRRRAGMSFLATRKREDNVRKDRAHTGSVTLQHADDDSSTTLEIETRPGTFAYGRLDGGTKALAEWILPGVATRILDLGAGCGTLGLYAASRLPAARAVLVDSNVRAVECARRNIERAGFGDRVDALERADLDDIPGMPGGYDLVLTNPPYFSGFRIATAFVQTAFDALGPEGRLALVARSGKAAHAHAEIVQDVFGGGELTECGAYSIVYSRRK